MGKANPQPVARLDSWARRLLQGVRSGQARSPSIPDSRSTPPDLQELSLAIAACGELNQELPALLRPLERNLELQASTQAPCRLILALQLPGQQAPTLITTQDNDIRRFPGEQLKDALAQIDHGDSRTLSLPGHEPLLLTGESVDAGRIWLIAAGNLSLSSATRRRLEGMAQAIARGLTIWHGHQQRLEAAVQHERRTHAAELHDSLAQILGYLRLGISRLDARCSRCNQPELQAIAADLSRQTGHAYRLMRELISSSRLSLEGGTLHSALRATVREFEQRSGLIFELDDRCQAVEADESTAVQLVMIAREALSNAVRHAHASHLRVQLFAKGAGVRMRIEDNGQGIDKSQARQDSYGLEIMRERATRIGASLSIGERPAAVPASN